MRSMAEQEEAASSPWGTVIGGIDTLLVKRGRFLEIGGLASERFRASDFWMVARYAKLFGLISGAPKHPRRRWNGRCGRRPRTDYYSAPCSRHLAASSPSGRARTSTVMGEESE